jgi:hypothetical protein
VRPAFRLAILAILASATLSANADTIYSNFGPGQTYNTAAGFGLGFFINATQVVAMPFVPTETATLTDVILALNQTMGTSPVNVFIESSSGGAPGSVLDSLTQVGNLPTTPSLVDFICSTCSALDAGTMYFVVGQQSDPADHTSWLNTLSGTGTFYSNLTGSATGPWSPVPGAASSAFEVNGTPAPTPEPSSITFIATGIAALVGVANRKRRSI